MIQFDEHVFLRWVGEKPPTRNLFGTGDFCLLIECLFFFFVEAGGWNRWKPSLVLVSFCSFVAQQQVFGSGYESVQRGPVGTSLGGDLKHFLFSPLFGEDFQFDYYFSDGLKPPTRS